MSSPYRSTRERHSIKTTRHSVAFITQNHSESAACFSASQRARNGGTSFAAAHGMSNAPELLRVDEVAALLRTTPKAIYAMVERRSLPGVVRIGRRVLVRRDVLLGALTARDVDETTKVFAVKATATPEAGRR